MVIQSFFQFCLWDETRWENEGGGDRGRFDLFRVCGKGVSLYLGTKCALLMLPMLISVHHPGRATRLRTRPQARWMRVGIWRKKSSCKTFPQVLCLHSAEPVVGISKSQNVGLALLSSETREIGTWFLSVAVILKGFLFNILFAITTKIASSSDGRGSGVRCAWVQGGVAV